MSCRGRARALLASRALGAARAAIAVMHVVSVGFPIDAAAQTPPPTVAPVPIEKSEASLAADAGVERIEAVKTRAIIARFEAANPGSKRVDIGLASTNQEIDARAPALRLKAMWQGATGTLFEVEGLPRSGNAYSAVMRRDTLRIRGRKGGMSGLTDSEGVTELRDKRGGAALLIKPGESAYLLFERVDDYWPFTMYHVDHRGEDSVYFVDVDPRFRERYDAMFASAKTPDTMKDFLVEFAANDPDKRVPKVFSQLIGLMRAQNTFEGFYTAYLLIQDPDDGTKAARLARTDEQRMKLEHLAIVGLVDKNRLFKVDMSVDPAQASGGENTDNGNPFAHTLNFFAGKDKVRSAYRPIRGTLSVQLQSASPIKVKYGSYVAKFRVTAVAPTESSAAGFVASRGGPGEARVSREVSIRFDAASRGGTARFDLGAMRVAYYDRGMLNGYTRERLTGDISVEARLIGVEIAR